MDTPRNPSKWPIDFDSLRRGSSLSAKQLEGIFGLHRFDEKFRFKALDLKSQIESHFRDLGDVVAVRMRQYGLQILTHAEQAEFVRLRERLSRRVQLRSYIQADAVDRSSLTPEQRTEHDRFLRVAAFRRQLMSKRPPPLLGE